MFLNSVYKGRSEDKVLHLLSSTGCKEFWRSANDPGGRLIWQQVFAMSGEEPWGISREAPGDNQGMTVMMWLQNEN